MKSILKDTGNSERLLRMTSDTMILMNKDGVCVDISVNNDNLWFLKEEILLGKNLLTLLPPITFNKFYPEFKNTILHKTTSIRNYELNLQDKVYFFKCIMQPYDDLILCQYRDITERSLQKIEMEKKNKELFETQKAALIGSWSYNSKTQYFIYTGHTDIMCTEDEQLISLDTYLAHIVPDDKETFKDWLDKTLNGSVDSSIDYRISYQKQIYYIRLKAYSIEHNEDGSTILDGYIQNITAIQRRRNDINLLTNAINNSTEDIYAAWEDGTLIFVNRCFRQRHNIDNTVDISTLKIFELPTYGRDEQSWSEFAAGVKSGEYNNDYIVHNPLPLSPETLAIEANSYWVTSDKGKGTVWTFGRDVSKRLRQEQEIKQLNQILDKIVENLPAGIVVKDIQNDYRYIYRNRESYNRSINMQESLGKNDYDYYSIDEANEKRQQDVEVATTGKELHWIAELNDINDNPIYLDKRKIKIESKDFSPIILSIEWDITDMELMKRELIKAKEKAETSDQLKSAFLANMSHEIRTPLNAIVGFSRVIAESEDANERKRYHNIVDANNERLLQLINEILELSKIEAGIVEFAVGPVRLHQLCDEILDSHKIRSPQGVELVFDESDETIVIDSDKNRIFQVISNLIGNAFKFTTQGSISFGYCKKGDDVEFHVSDTGAGIPPEKIDKVFERFVKANNFAQGTGLGLAICKSIIERLGGSISVASEAGMGTTFSFVLPAYTSQTVDMEMVENAIISNELSEEEQEIVLKSAEIVPVTHSANEPMKTILVAEDSDSNYILVKAILGKEYKLERAKDGMEVVNMFVEINPDIILMDMKMPNLGGLDATRIIRELSPTISIIALTAFAYDHDRQAAFEAGCNAFITKPFTQEDLKDTINKLIRKA